MQTYIQHLAADLLYRFGTDLSHVAIVFPNKRASLFLNHELARQAHAVSGGQPLWSPSYITISDLFRRHSALTVADEILLVCRLYDVFTASTGFSAETLDHFYNWGRLLLADFDDLDKNMAEAEQVFQLVTDLHQLDNADYLTDSQRQTLRQFFGSFADNPTSQMQEKFRQLWSRLLEIYTTFREQLRADGLAYEGMLYRDVADDMSIEFEHDTYCFVGFNMLQKVEQRLFSRLQAMPDAAGSSQPRALFYWDYDAYYLNDRHEAGHFIKQYLSLYPDAMRRRYAELNGEGVDENAQPQNLIASKTDSNITYVSAKTETQQARYVHDWLLEKDRWRAGARTAIVLCDEMLLQTVIRSLPEQVDKVNITTGFPLRQTPIFTLVQQLIELQTQGLVVGTRRFRLRYVRNILCHPYIQHAMPQAAELDRHLLTRGDTYPDAQTLGVTDTMQLIFSPVDEVPLPDICDGQDGLPEQNIRLCTWLLEILRIIASDQTLPALDSEAVFRMYQIVQRLQTLSVTIPLRIDIVTLRRLLVQIVDSTTVPYHGEPIEGIQIMGVLETRCLDFEHILLLSCNEGNMPKGVDDASFIPHSVRKAYGMTTVEHKVGIYSYYFHRLLQRATDVTLAYNTSTQGTNAGEMSRFMLQLMVESGLNISRYALSAGESVSHTQPTTIEKNPGVLAQLEQLLERPNGFSPTAFSTYLRCPAAFYYKYVAGIREPDDDLSGEIDGKAFGTIFHRAAEYIYQRIQDSQHVVHAKEIAGIRSKEKTLMSYVDAAFRKEVFNLEPDDHSYAPPYNGLQIINRRVIQRLLGNMLAYDMRYTPFTISGTECRVMDTIQIDISGQQREVKISGYIDRLDMTPIRREGDNGAGGGKYIRIIDYKTGNSLPKAPKTVAEIFDPANIRHHSDYYLQTFLYALIVSRSALHNPDKLPVSPQLLFVQKAGGKDYSACLEIDGKPVYDIADYADEYLANLRRLIEEIFDPETPFMPVADDSICRHCVFWHICNA